MRQKHSVVLLAATLIASSTMWAQTGASIVNLGYQTARSPLVAPGQVLHLTLHGLTTSFDATQVATALPLPTNFNGLSVSLLQSGASTPILLPLLDGSGVLSCDRGFAVSFIVPANLVACPTEDATFDLVVQIPFNLMPNPPGIDNTCPAHPCPGINDAVLTISESAGTGASLRVFPVEDQVHILNSCTDNVPTVTLGGGSVYSTYPCYPVIPHANYTGVSPDSPATPGEVLTAYAFGLGVPDTTVTTVSGTPASGVPVSRPFTLSFTGVTAPGYSSPSYVGLVGGNAGLYQINFQVPAVPTGLPKCDAQHPSNLTMTIQGTASVDQVSFWVQP
jgi:uncharacterized protein (TIGR03437 family)